MQKIIIPDNIKSNPINLMAPIKLRVICFLHFMLLKFKILIKATHIHKYGARCKKMLFRMQFED